MGYSPIYCGIFSCLLWDNRLWDFKTTPLISLHDLIDPRQRCLLAKDTLSVAGGSIAGGPKGNFCFVIGFRELWIRSFALFFAWAAESEAGEVLNVVVASANEECGNGHPSYDENE